MKIAIFHDFFGTIGGGEKLVVELARALHADIYTTEKNEKNIKLMDADDVNIFLLARCIRLPVLKQITSSIIFSRAKIPKYDFYILSGNWSLFAAKKHKSNLLYCHTPVRMFYQAYDDFYKLSPWFTKPLFALWVKIHRYLLEKTLPHIQKVVANSQDCKARIKKYYHKESIVINPPIKQYKFRKYGNFWLSVNRIYPHKRIELQLKAFRKMPHEKLVIVGGTTAGDHSNHYNNEMRKCKPDNVSFIGEVSEEKLARLYGECKGFITTSEKEDFGMNVLEAMSAGKPVIAPDEGGYKETIINGKTGLLIKPDVNSIINAVRLISKRISHSTADNHNKYKTACMSNAEKYSAKKFIAKMKKEIECEKQR